MEYFCIILLHAPRIGRAQSLPKEEVLRQQLRSENAQQQVGPCSTAMIQDGREFLPDADAVCTQELESDADSAYGLLHGEALSQKANNVGKAGSLGQVKHPWDREYSQTQNDTNTRGGRD